MWNAYGRPHEHARARRGLGGCIADRASIGARLPGVRGPFSGAQGPPKHMNAVPKTASPTTQAAGRQALAQCRAAAKAVNHRLHERLPINSRIHVCCPDRQGVQRCIRALAVNMSKFGMLVESAVAIAPRTVIFLQTANFAALGKASVRHCTQKGLRYEIGLYMPDRPARGL